MHDFISIIDTERFGFPIAKLPNQFENPELILKELKSCSTHLVIARIDLKNLIMINQLEKLGFLIKDMQLTFNFQLNNKIPKIIFNYFTLTSITKESYLSEILEISGLSFDNYGHYFADNKLDRQKCNGIYIDWVQRCFSDKSIADHIIIAAKANVAIGFLALKLHVGKDEKYAAGVIGAVSPEYRKMGVFQAINIESLNWAKTLGLNRVENNVLATNFSVLKTYSSLNYSIIKSEVTMHYWFD